MTPARQLRIRAHRMATDGLRHSPAAIAWARVQLAPEVEARERRYPRPTAKEVATTRAVRAFAGA